MVHKENKGGASRPLEKMKTSTFHGIAEGNLGDNYELLEQIGKGACGVVRKAIDKSTGTVVCCKTIPKALLEANPDVIEDIKREAGIMLHLRGHRHVVEIMGMFEDEESIHIVQELCSGGDLYSKLTKTVVPYTEREASGILHSILEVLQHCHNSLVLYRDVKPDNFLLSTDGPDAVLKATDFGISKFLQPNETVSEYCGTPTYMAPEVLDGKYGFPADIWAAGVTLYFVLSGEFPFKGKNSIELSQRIYAAEPNMDSGGWDQVSAEAKDCIRLMLTKDPAKRPTATELLAHKWFKQAGTRTKPLGNMVLTRMRSFAAMNGFKKEVMRYISHNLGEEYLCGLRSMFAAMDKSNTGNLSCIEVCDALESQGAQFDPKEVQDLVNKIDGNGDGNLDFFEFVSAALNHSLLEKKDLLQQAFDHFDLDKDGCISKTELSMVIRSSGRHSEAALAHLLASVHFDAEGKLGFPEFCTMMFGSTEFQSERDGFLHRMRTKVNEPGGLFSTKQRVPAEVPNIYKAGEKKNTNVFTYKSLAMSSQSSATSRASLNFSGRMNSTQGAMASPRGSAADLTALSPFSPGHPPTLAPAGGSGGYPNTPPSPPLPPGAYLSPVALTSTRMRRNSLLSNQGGSPTSSVLDRAGTSSVADSLAGLGSPTGLDLFAQAQRNAAGAATSPHLHAADSPPAVVLPPGAATMKPAKSSSGLKALLKGFRSQSASSQHSDSGAAKANNSAGSSGGALPAAASCAKQVVLRAADSTLAHGGAGATASRQPDPADPAPFLTSSSSNGLGPFAAKGASVAHHVAATAAASPRSDAAFAAVFSPDYIPRPASLCDPAFEPLPAALLLPPCSTAQGPAAHAASSPQRRSPAPQLPGHASPPHEAAPSARPKCTSPFSEAAASNLPFGSSLSFSQVSSGHEGQQRAGAGQGPSPAPPRLPPSSFQHALTAATIAAGGAAFSLADGGSGLVPHASSPPSSTHSSAHSPLAPAGGSTGSPSPLPLSKHPHLALSTAHLSPGSAAQRPGSPLGPRPTLAALKYAASSTTMSHKSSKSTKSSGSGSGKHRPLFERSDTERARECAIM